MPILHGAVKTALLFGLLTLVAVIEPQNWKSYTSLVKRWKRLTPPQLPPPLFSSLKWKQNVVSAIHDCLAAGLKAGATPPTSTQAQNVAAAAAIAAASPYAAATSDAAFVHSHSFGASEWGRLLWLFTRRTLLAAHKSSSAVALDGAKPCCADRIHCTLAADCISLPKLQAS
jgi:hypothetical protein